MEAPSSIARELSPLALDASGEDGCAQAGHPQTQAELMHAHDCLQEELHTLLLEQTEHQVRDADTEAGLALTCQETPEKLG